jgi:hypothetical protein
MRGYAQFLTASWDAAWTNATLMKHVNPSEFMADWAQSNWELLVETAVRETFADGQGYLEVYGEGADCNDASSRVWRPQVLPTHRVMCRARENTMVVDLLTGRRLGASQSFIFDHFAARSGGGWYMQTPPFDCVLGYLDTREVLISIEAVSFFIDAMVEPDA